MRSFIENLTVQSKEFKKSINESTKFITPISSPEISSNLRGNNSVESIFDYISQVRKLHPIIRIYRSFENIIIRNPSMNPHKDFFPLKYYVWDQSLLDTFDSIIDSIEKSTFQKFIHIGNKGAGKTITQNCWLHENNSKLEHHNIFWVRCDVHKIYQMWEKMLVDPRSLIIPVTIEQYLKIQFLYVFAKNIKASTLFKDIFEKIIENKATYIRRQSRKRDDLFEEIAMENGIKEIIKNLEIEKCKESGYSYAMYIVTESLLKTNTKRFVFDKWISLSDALQRFVLDNGYKILKIVDGLDNVEFLNDKGLRHYKNMINDATSFVSSTPESGVFRFISMRPETFHDIRRNVSHATDPVGFDAHYQTIEHKTPNLHDVLERRLESFFDTYEEESKSVPEYSLYIKILRNTFTIHDKFYENYGFFNFSIRLLLHSKLSMTMQILFRYLQRNAYFELLTFKKYHTEFFRRNLFLNGRLFLNTENSGLTILKQGISLYNIFYFDYQYIEFSASKWRGLCTTRIMQLLRRTNGATRNKILTIIYEQFGYPKGYINKCINRLITYSFITSYSDKKFHHVLFKMTSKGKLALDYIFKDFDILYFLSLDTPLPDQLIEKKFINSHKNDVNNFDPNIYFPIKSHYPSAAIMSTLSFVLFLHNINLHEQKNISEEYKNVFKDPFDMPSKARIFRRLQILYNSSNDDEKETINKYFLNIGFDKITQEKNVLVLTKNIVHLADIDNSEDDSN